MHVQEGTVAVAYSSTTSWKVDTTFDLDRRRDVQVNMRTWWRSFFLIDDDVKREELNAQRHLRPIVPGGFRGFWKLHDLKWAASRVFFEEVATGLVAACDEATFEGLKQHNRIVVVSSDAPTPEITVRRLSDLEDVSPAELERLTGLVYTDLQRERPTQERRTR